MHKKRTEPIKKRAPKMIKYRSSRQLSLSEFILPFNGSLDKDNRWVKLANILPWDELVSVYARGLSSRRGRGTLDLRVELGVLLIQGLMGYTDREVIAQIQENPYLQYFLGYEEYSYRRVFDPSLLVTIRKRLGREVIAELTRVIARYKQALEEDGPPPDNSSSPGDDSGGSGVEEVDETPPPAASEKDDPVREEKRDVSNRGELLIDATAAELEIPYPTDLGLLNEARMQSERLIDLLWASSKQTGRKPRTYRQKARAAYLSVAKKRRKSRKQIRRGIKQQLQYLRRNIKIIKMLLSELGPKVVNRILSHRDRELIKTIQLVYEQQRIMYKEKRHRIENRIVNLYQPWVRPIKRGKSGSEVEFGPKLSVGLVEGIAYVDHFSWEAYNESTYLRQQVEAYYKRYGYYPEVVIGDGIYGSRENRRYLKSLGIRFSGKPLGRPLQEREENKQQIVEEKKRRQEEQRRRNRIEGRFGVGRRRYGLGRVRTRLASTSETAICMAFFAMSVAAYFAAYFACFVAKLNVLRGLKKLYKAICGLQKILMLNFYPAGYILNSPV